MNKKPSIERLDQKVKLLEKEILGHRETEEKLLEKQAELITILENSPTIMLLVDREKRLQNAAHALLEFTGKREEEILGRPGGEVLRCFHALDDPKGCGFGPACNSCAVRQMVTDAFETGKNHHRVEVKLPLARDGTKADMYFYVSVAPLATRKRDLVLVCIEDITELRQAESALIKVNDELERRVEQRTAQLRELSYKLLVAYEEESKRIGQELHDGLAQTLSAIKVWVEAAMTQASQENLSDMTRSLNSVVPLAQNAVEEVRRISKNLRPAILDDFGIIATVSWLCDEFKAIYSGIRVDKEIDVLEVEVPDILKIVIFRLSQEALNNITKHSRADRVNVSLKRMGAGIELTITDNGVGFDVEDVMSGELTERGLGLVGMKERTTLSGGEFFVESRKEAGTTIRASWEKGRVPL